MKSFTLCLAALTAASGAVAGFFDTDFKIYGDEDGERVVIYGPLDPSKAEDRLCQTGADKDITLVEYEIFFHEFGNDKFCVYGFGANDCEELTTMWNVTANSKQVTSLGFSQGLASMAIAQGLCPAQIPETWKPVP